MLLYSTIREEKSYGQKITRSFSIYSSISHDTQGPIMITITRRYGEGSVDDNCCSFVLQGEIKEIVDILSKFVSHSTASI